MKISGLILLLLLFQIIDLEAQQIQLSCTNSTISDVLIDISRKHSVSISFDHEELSTHKVNIEGIYKSLEEALTDLLSGTGLVFEYTGNVYIIYTEQKFVRTVISGIVTDKHSREALPFSHVKINDQVITTDLSGNFALSGKFQDSTAKIKVSHLGYYILDSVLSIDSFLDIKLEPSAIGLSEIIVSGKTVETSSQFGSQPGLMKLNHKIAHFLPGYGDNSVFNLIRLLPGILASGEQTSELIIWGGYEGQSEVIFDGFTVYGLRNFNDNISTFNPLLAKEVEINKGGYGATYGDRIGGIVNIVGKNGTPQRTSATIAANNMTINGMIELPIAKRGSLLLAMRHTYYNLYNPSDMNALIEAEHDSIPDLDITIYPKYMFRDANIKYSNTFRNNDLFYISMHGGDDKFSYSFDNNLNQKQYIKNTSENNLQLGGTVYYGRNWRNGNLSDISISYSSLNSSYTDDYRINTLPTDEIQYITDKTSENSLKEYSLRISNSISFGSIHMLVGGLEIKQNSVFMDEYSFGELVSYFRRYNNRITAFIEDKVFPASKIDIRAGFRITYVPGVKNIFVEPRFGVNYRINDCWKIVGAIGYYNQFIALTTITDEFGNYRYFWTLSDNDEIPVLGSMQYVLGLKYNLNQLIISAETYYKTITGLSRYYNIENYNIQDIFYGSASSYGIDLLVKKNLKAHSAWISYSFSNTYEKFNYSNYEEKLRSPHDQRHEFKIAMMLNFDPVFFSSNYVYGSGFPMGNDSESNVKDTKPYNRLDVSLIYKLLDRSVKGEVGISVLNVLNNKNIKYRSFESVPVSHVNQINIQADAIPFTPTVYFKFML